MRYALAALALMATVDMAAAQQAAPTMPKLLAAEAKRPTKPVMAQVMVPPFESSAVSAIG